MQISPVFEETYQNYLKEIQNIDFLAKADLLGVDREGDHLVIPIYNRPYRFGAEGITGRMDNGLTPAVRVVLCKYLLTCPPELPPSGNVLKTYREFKGAGPLVSSFTSNTNKTIESSFSGRLDDLKRCSLALGGETLDSPSYDYSVRFHALPRIPVLLNFNDRDDMFPATCSVLFKDSAEHFLDMECLAITGTLLTGRLLKGLE